jgi:tetratricopeptide (TPR) repeat protein
MNNVASAYREVGRTDEARSMFEQTLEMKRKVQGAGLPTTIVTMNNLASLYVDDGRLDDAERLYREAVELTQDKEGPGMPRIAALNGLAHIFKVRNQPAESEKYLDQAVEVARDVMGPKHPQLIVLLANLSSIRLAAGQSQRAEEAAREAIALEVELGKDTGPNTIIPRRSLARALAAQNRHAEAASVMAALLEVLPGMREETRNNVAAECAKYFGLAGNAEEAARYQAMIPATQPTTVSSRGL